MAEGSNHCKIDSDCSFISTLCCSRTQLLKLHFISSTTAECFHPRIIESQLQANSVNEKAIRIGCLRTSAWIIYALACVTAGSRVLWTLWRNSKAELLQQRFFTGLSSWTRWQIPVAACCDSPLIAWKITPKRNGFVRYHDVVQLHL